MSWNSLLIYFKDIKFCKFPKISSSKLAPMYTYIQKFVMYLIYVYGLMFKKRKNSIEYINIKTKIKKMFVSTKSIYFVDLSSGPKRRA